MQKFQNVLHPLFLEHGTYEDNFIIISYVPAQLSNNLPQMDFDHAFHSDVIMTLVNSKKLRLTYIEDITRVVISYEIYRTSLRRV